MNIIHLRDEVLFHGFKLTLAFPQWEEFIANDSTRLDLVRQWKTQGHEIGFQHHPVTHVDRDAIPSQVFAGNADETASKAVIDIFDKQ